MAQFKPNRTLLNVNFEGYKLSEQSLRSVTRPLPADVRTARLKENQFSYQHVRAVSLHNHLTLCPYDTTRAYWFGADDKIYCARFQVEREEMAVSVQPVYSVELPANPPASSINASLVFVDGSLCLFSDGRGSLSLLDTGPESSRAGGSSGVWRLLENLPMNGLDEVPFSVLTARLNKDSRSLEYVSMELNDSSTLVVEQRVSRDSPTLALFRWHRVTFHGDVRDFDPLEQAPQGGWVEGSTVLCVLNSRAIPLHCDLIGKTLIIISEATIARSTPMQSDAQSDVVTSSTHSDDLESGNRERHEGLGYRDEGASGKKQGGPATNGQQQSSETQTSDQARPKEDATETTVGEGVDQKSKAPEEAGQAQVKIEPTYIWSQSDSDITITVRLPDDVIKRDISYSVQPREIILGLTDGTTFIRGDLHAPVDPEASGWSIEHNTLEVLLEKQYPGQWPSLLCIDTEDSRQAQPQSEGTSRSIDSLSEAELRAIEERVGMAVERGGASEKPHPPVHDTLEECDLVEEDAAAFVVSEDGTVVQRSSLGGHQFLFSIEPSGDARGHKNICLRYDVDALIWEPVSNQPGGPISWSHRASFNALGYIQASKTDRKFIVCPPDTRFAVLSDCNRHVFIYRLPSSGVQGNSALQHVHTMASTAEILGLQAASSHVFVLTKNELNVLLV